jgi:GntR family transcriptional regulator/MocR family aminotransferase
MIIEDDYDSELRYVGQPLASLQGLDRADKVIYLGTFSKVLFPALRLGYVVLPQPLVQPFERALNLLGRGAPTLTQAAVADFIREGYFERHLRRLRHEYGLRWRVLVAALDEHLGQMVSFSREATGLQVMVFLPAFSHEKTIIHEAAKVGVGVYGGAKYHFASDTPPPPSLLLGFSGLSEAEIAEGVKRLATIIKKQNPAGN